MTIKGAGPVIEIWKGIRQVAWPFRIYARDDEGQIIRDNTGKPVVSYPATVFARILAISVILYAADNGINELFGMTLKEIVHIILFS